MVMNVVKDNQTAANLAVIPDEVAQSLHQSHRELESKIAHLSRRLAKAEEEKQQRIKAEKAMASQFNGLLEFLPGGVIVLDEKGVVITANPAACQLLDNPLEGKIWRNVVSESFAPRQDDGFEVSTKKGKRLSLSTGSIAQQGQIILLNDLTETRRLQNNLSQYQKMSVLGKMVSALAHQIRTPLSAAMLYAGHLQNPNLDADKKQQFTKKIYGRLHHMEKQVRDMLLFVKSELPLNDLISIDDLETGLKEAAEVTLSAENVQSHWRNTVPDLKIKCNREALISALMNLVNNGIQACRHPAHILIKFKIAGDHQEWLKISVCDNGSGMDPSELSQSKDLFYTTKSQGTGLGITVVQSVAKAHGGRFEVKSSVGKGTCASILIPISR